MKPSKKDGVGRLSVSPTLRGILSESRYLSDGAAPAARPDYEPDGPPVGTSKRKVLTATLPGGREHLIKLSPSLF